MVASRPDPALSRFHALEAAVYAAAAADLPAMLRAVASRVGCGDIGEGEGEGEGEGGERKTGDDYTWEHALWAHLVAIRERRRDEALLRRRVAQERLAPSSGGRGVYLLPGDATGASAAFARACLDAPQSVAAAAAAAAGAAAAAAAGGDGDGDGSDGNGSASSSAYTTGGILPILSALQCADAFCHRHRRRQREAGGHVDDVDDVDDDEEGKVEMGDAGSPWRVAQSALISGEVASLLTEYLAPLLCSKREREREDEEERWDNGAFSAPSSSSSTSAADPPTPQLRRFACHLVLFLRALRDATGADVLRELESWERKERERRATREGGSGREEGEGEGEEGETNGVPSGITDACDAVVAQYAVHLSRSKRLSLVSSYSAQLPASRRAEVSVSLLRRVRSVQERALCLAEAMSFFPRVEVLPLLRAVTSAEMDSRSPLPLAGWGWERSDGESGSGAPPGVEEQQWRRVRSLQWLSLFLDVSREQQQQQEEEHGQQITEEDAMEQEEQRAMCLAEGLAQSNRLARLFVLEAPAPEDAAETAAERVEEGTGGDEHIAAATLDAAREGLLPPLRALGVVLRGASDARRRQALLRGDDVAAAAAAAAANGGGPRGEEPMLLPAVRAASEEDCSAVAATAAPSAAAWRVASREMKCFEALLDAVDRVGEWRAALRRAEVRAPPPREDTVSSNETERIAQGQASAAYWDRQRARAETVARAASAATAALRECLCFPHGFFMDEDEDEDEDGIGGVHGYGGEESKMAEINNENNEHTAGPALDPAADAVYNGEGYARRTAARRNRERAQLRKRLLPPLALLLLRVLHVTARWSLRLAEAYGRTSTTMLTRAAASAPANADSARALRFAKSLLRRAVRVSELVADPSAAGGALASLFSRSQLRRLLAEVAESATVLTRLGESVV